MTELTHEEIGILLEALDAWVNRRSSGELVGEMLEALIGKGSPEAKTKRDERRREARREQQLDADVATLLKAKLIQLRQKQSRAHV